MYDHFPYQRKSKLSNKGRVEHKDGNPSKKVGRTESEIEQQKR